MRTKLFLLALSFLVGCAGSAVHRSHGETKKAYAGGLPLVFTNATPDKMCGLYMSDNRLLDYGDNWLDGRGLPSGMSIVVNVKPGAYKAKWETCPKQGSLPTYAAVLWRETGFDIDQETQLYAYVAEATPPTKRAALLDRDHAKVMFQGQAVAPIGSAQPVPVAPIAKRDEPTARPTAKTKPMFADVVERPSKKRAKR
jgi:hypothetical protein